MPEKTKDHALNTWLRIAEGLILILGSAVSCLLTTYCLSVTGINTLEIEKIYLNPDSPLSKLLWVFFSFLGILILYVIYQKLPGKDKIPGWFVCGLLILAIIAVWIFWSRELNPGLHGDDDTGICWSVAGQLAAGNYDTFQPMGYLVRYPQQLGIVLVNLFSMMLMGNGKSFVLFYVLNLILYLFLVVLGADLARTLTATGKEGADNRFSSVLWWMAAVLNLPLFLYIDYMYGEMAFAAGVIAGAALLAKILNGDVILRSGKKLGATVFFLVIIGISVLLRQNSLIFVIAALIILALSALDSKQNRKSLVILMALVIAVTVLPGKIGHGYFRARSGETPEKGMGASLHIAMGLQDEWNGPGWYTNLNQAIYFANEGDPARCHADAMDFIRGKLAEFRDDPAYTADFYKRKIQTQWCDPSCDSLHCTLRNALEDEKAADWIRNLLEGANRNRLWKFMDLYQAWVYVGFTIYMIRRLLRFFTKRGDASQNDRRLWEDLLILTVIGGFLFSILWEAKSRYVLQYELAMLPMAVAGYTAVAAAVIAFATKHTSGGQKASGAEQTAEDGGNVVPFGKKDGSKERRKEKA